MKRNQQICHRDDIWSEHPELSDVEPWLIRILISDADEFARKFCENFSELKSQPVGVQKARDDLFHMLKLAAVKMISEYVRDPLTGLMNRKSFSRACSMALNTESECGGSGKQQFARVDSLLIIDADHFKRINDKWGHTAGDQCLRILAGIIKKMTWNSNCIASRWGGEEFAVFFPDTDMGRAIEVAREIRRKLAVSVSNDRELPPVTISCGIAMLEGRDEKKLDDLLACADQALRDAKKRGRDRIECYSDESDNDYCYLSSSLEGDGFVVAIGPGREENWRLKLGAQGLNKVHAAIRKRLGRRQKKKRGDLIISFLQMDRESALKYCTKLIQPVADVPLWAGLAASGGRPESDVKDAVSAQYCSRFYHMFTDLFESRGICFFKPEIFDIIGWSKLERGDYKGALPLLQEAHAMGVKNSRFICNLAAALELAGRDEEALQVLESAKRYFKQLRPEILSNMTTLYLRKEMPHKAEQCCRELLKMRPDCTKTLNNLALSIRKSGGDLEEALEFASRAVNLGKEGRFISFYMDTMAMILLEMGDVHRALKLLEEAAKLSSDMEIRHNLAVVKRIYAGRKRQGDVKKML